MWRVQTDRGRFAVKELIEPLTEPEVAVDVALQSTMVARGVYAPRPLLTPAGKVLTSVGPLLFRAYTWVDIEDERLDLDPAAVGTLLATLHRDPLPADPPVDPWYTDPVPDADWTVVAERLAVAGAPFAAELAASVPAEAVQELAMPLFDFCRRDPGRRRGSARAGSDRWTWPASTSCSTPSVQSCRDARADLWSCPFRDGGPS